MYWQFPLQLKGVGSRQQDTEQDIALGAVRNLKQKLQQLECRLLHPYASSQPSTTSATAARESLSLYNCNFPQDSIDCKPHQPPGALSYVKKTGVKNSIHDNTGLGVSSLHAQQVSYQPSKRNHSSQASVEKDIVDGIVLQVRNLGKQKTSSGNNSLNTHSGIKGEEGKVKAPAKADLNDGSIATLTPHSSKPERYVHVTNFEEHSVTDLDKNVRDLQDEPEHKKNNSEVSMPKRQEVAHITMSKRQLLDEIRREKDEHRKHVR